MSFTHNAAPPSEGFSLLPDGTYDLQVTDFEERKSSKGYPMVNVTCEVINNPEFNGKKVFHNVTFLPKETNGKPTPGAGMSSHFLKCINQPYEGDITVDPVSWVGEKFKAKIAEEDFTYSQGPKMGQTRKVNSIKEVKASDGIAF